MKHNSMDGRKGWKRATRWRDRKDLRSLDGKRSVKKVYARANGKGSYYWAGTTKCRNG